MTASSVASIAARNFSSLRSGFVRSRRMRPDSISVSLSPIPFPVSMRVRRSFGAMTRRTPLSSPFLPMPHVLNAAYATSSMEAPPSCPPRRGLRRSCLYWLHLLVARRQRDDGQKEEKREDERGDASHLRAYSVLMPGALLDVRGAASVRFEKSARPLL